MHSAAKQIIKAVKDLEHPCGDDLENTTRSRTASSTGIAKLPSVSTSCSSSRSSFSFSSDESSNERRNSLVDWQGEHCDCCTKEDFLHVFDTFDFMDQQNTGIVNQSNFKSVLNGIYGSTAEFQKIAKKAKLKEFFAKSAELTLGEFIRRVYTTASQADVISMLRWARWHKVGNQVDRHIKQLKLAIAQSNYKATMSELRQIFGLLDHSSSGLIAVEELRNSEIFNDEDMFALLCTEVPPSHKVQFDEFSLLVLSKFEPDDSQGSDQTQMSNKTVIRHPYIQKFGKIRSQLRSSDRFTSVCSMPRKYHRDSDVPPQAAW